MPYRPTERTEAKRTAARAAILDAAHALVAGGGYRAAQVADVAQRAGVATGTVYRHFGSKSELFAEVFRIASQREVDRVAAAAGAPPTPARQRIAAGVETFATRALRGRRLAWALLAEPVDPAVEAERLVFRRAYADVFAAVLADGVAAGELPAQDPATTAALLVGAIAEALVGPLSPTESGVDAAQLTAALVAFCTRAITEEPLHVDR